MATKCINFAPHYPTHNMSVAHVCIIFVSNSFLCSPISLAVLIAETLKQIFVTRIKTRSALKNVKGVLQMTAY